MRLRALCTLAVLGTLPAAGQAPAPKPEFEVASVKPSPSGETISIRRSGGRLTTTSTSLRMLITWAYGIEDDRLAGQPKWLDDVRYDIKADAPEERISRGELYAMMQSLLVERFRLAVHHETREMPIYALVVDKGGPKVKITEANGPGNQDPFRMTGRGHLIGTRVSPPMLAKVLSNQLRRAVQDATGINGIFDFTLEWSGDDLSSVEGDLSRAPRGPSIFTALREQLGLRLEARKGPEDVLVIDHVERVPSEN